MGVMAVFPLYLLLSSLDVTQSIESPLVSLTAPQGRHPRLLANWCKVARCAEIDGRRWVVIQSRQNGKVSFEQSWDRYRLGFGNPTAALDAWDADHWLGLDAIHHLCPKTRPCQLRVELTYHGNIPPYVNPTPNGRYVAHYRRFAVAGAADNYRLSVSGYNAAASTAGDGLRWHDIWPKMPLDGAEFSTKDADHDTLDGGSCSLISGYQGWWFKACSNSGLNGRWAGGRDEGLVWWPVTGPRSAASSRMLVRMGRPRRRPPAK